MNDIMRPIYGFFLFRYDAASYMRPAEGVKIYT